MYLSQLCTNCQCNPFAEPPMMRFGTRKLPSFVSALRKRLKIQRHSAEVINASIIWCRAALAAVRDYNMNLEWLSWEPPRDPAGVQPAWFIAPICCGRLSVEASCCDSGPSGGKGDIFLAPSADTKSSWWQHGMFWLLWLTIIIPAGQLLPPSSWLDYGMFMGCLQTQHAGTVPWWMAYRDIQVPI